MDDAWKAVRDTIEGDLLPQLKASRAAADRARKKLAPPLSHLSDQSDPSDPSENSKPPKGPSP